MLKINVVASSSKGNLILIENSTTKLMIDCGLPIKQIIQATKGNIDKYTLLITHEHFADHCKSIKDLKQRQIPIICNQSVADKYELKNYHKLLVTEKLNPDLQFGICKKLQIGDFTVIPLELKHTNIDGSLCPCNGYIIVSNETSETVLICLDFMYFPYNIGNTRIDYAMIEINYSESILENAAVNEIVNKRRLFSHCSLQTAMAILDSLNKEHLKKIYIMHTSDDADKKEIKNTIIERYGIPTEMINE